MSLISRVWRSSLGKKYIMAITGVILFLFLIVHMAGNLLVFLGPEALNTYGNFLQTTPEILWPSRAVLLTMLVLHFISAAQLTLENRASRPSPYANYEVVAGSFAARSMIISGFIILFFVIYHIMHYTIEVPGVNLTGQDFRTFTYMEGAKAHHNVYEMMVKGFNQPIVTGLYLVSIALLCIHLSHGVGSMFQSMGWKNKAYTVFIDRFAFGAAIVLFLGYCSVPVAILLGLVKLQ